MPDRKAGTLLSARALRILAGAIAPATAAALILGPPGAKAPGLRPPRPRRALFARRVGRWLAVGAGGTGLGGSVAQGWGKRSAFHGPAQRGNPFLRIGKIFPAGRRSDCFLSRPRPAEIHLRAERDRAGARPDPCAQGHRLGSARRRHHRCPDRRVQAGNGGEMAAA
jgi:hypothetical protein